MKKFVKYLMAVLALFVAIPLFAADGLPVDPESLFASFAALGAAIPLVVEAVKNLLKPDSKTVIQIISWVTGVAVTMFGWWLNLGFLDGLLWWNALAIGFFASLAANGVYDTGFYEWLLKVLGIYKK